MTVKKLADRVVKTDNVNPQQIKSVLKEQFNIASKHTSKYLLAQEVRAYMESFE
jgi:hypothetical protein